MRRHFIAALSALLVLSATRAAAQAPASAAAAAAEEAAVRTAVEQYLKSHATGNGDFVRTVFHPKLMMMWVLNDTLATRTSKEYTDGFRGQPPADEAQRRRWISSVDVAGTAAVAKLTLDYPSATLIDFLSLLKINGEWKVVGKIFSSQPKAPPAGR